MTPNKNSTPNNNEKFQRMIDNCVKMECSNCRKLVPTHLFYDHLVQTSNCSTNQGNRSPVMSFILNKSHDAFNHLGQLRYNSTMCVSNQTQFIQNIPNITDDEQIKNSFPSFVNDKIQSQPLGDISNEINTERTATKVSFLEEKLRKADELLRESAIEIKNLREEKDKFRLDNDRLRLKLEQTSTQLALVEEKKAENELEMKREIKYLLESWLQAKNQNTQGGTQKNTMQALLNKVQQSYGNCVEDQEELLSLNEDECSYIVPGNNKSKNYNRSVMGNFNPLTALDTFENNMMMEQCNTNLPSSAINSHMPSQRQQAMR